MIRILVIVLALLFVSMPDPHLQARWDTATSATISWTQTARGCLSVEHVSGERVFISCYEKYPVTLFIELGHAGPLSGDARPQGGDIFTVEIAGQSYRAPLRGRELYFPVWRG